MFLRAAIHKWIKRGRNMVTFGKILSRSYTHAACITQNIIHAVTPKGTHKFRVKAQWVGDIFPKMMDDLQVCTKTKKLIKFVTKTNFLTEFRKLPLSLEVTINTKAHSLTLCKNNRRAMAVQHTGTGYSAKPDKLPRLFDTFYTPLHLFAASVRRHKTTKRSGTKSKWVTNTTDS